MNVIFAREMLPNLYAVMLNLVLLGVYILHIAIILLLLNFITDSLYTYAGIYGSCPNQRKTLHYRDKLLQNTTRHEHIAAPSSGNVFLN